ncbi:MAG: alpha/beta hydrolase [Saprospiraceae bacterium]|nr:alpha/beta hydrolase [Saprospiraceae bacterium]
MSQVWKKLLPFLVGKALSLAGLIAPRKTVELSMRVFAKPRKGRVVSHQRKFLQKAGAAQLEVNGKQYHVHVFGNAGEPILLAHGWESNSWRWRKLMRYLGNEYYRFIALDAPGHGLTGSEYFNVSEYAEAIAAAAQEYACTTVIGHSIGGFACMYAAASYPEAGIKKVVSLAAPSSLKLIMEKYFSIISLSTYMQRKTFEFFPIMYGLHIDDLSVENFGQKIAASGLVIHDQHDTINGPESAHTIKQHWKKAELIITDYSDHSLQHDGVFERVREFIL